MNSSMSAKIAALAAAARDLRGGSAEDREITFFLFDHLIAELHRGRIASKVAARPRLKIRARPASLRMNGHDET